jgi:hypothetical protein
VGPSQVHVISPDRVEEDAMRLLFLTALSCLAGAIAWPEIAQAFCGFYVAGGDAKLFNRASQVVLVRDGDHTVITMANDYQGDPRKFAMVIPVPTVIERGQVHIGDPALIDHLDTYSAPRLVEYFDPDPCPVAHVRGGRAGADAFMGVDVHAERVPAVKYPETVQVLRKFAVDEYDVLVLSATESSGLLRWLNARGYKLPAEARPIVESYIRDGLKFFVAKVDLDRMPASARAMAAPRPGAATTLRAGAERSSIRLRPIQVAYESPRFALPIRLGTVNAAGPQDLLIYTLTRHGRVEATNYRTVRLKSDIDIPPHVKDSFGDFYRAMFDRQVRGLDMRAVITEYAWTLGWCDPCAGPPISLAELRALGAYWVGAAGPSLNAGRGAAFITRLHVRYDARHFPEDLVFQETADGQPFQSRFVLRHEWQGESECAQAVQYREALPARRRKEALALAELTGWRLDAIRDSMAVDADWSKPADHERWWQRIWK